METKQFAVEGDVDDINKKIFDVLERSWVFQKTIRIKNRFIVLNNATGMLHAIVTCEIK